MFSAAILRMQGDCATLGNLGHCVKFRIWATESHRLGETFRHGIFRWNVLLRLLINFETSPIRVPAPQFIRWSTGSPMDKSSQLTARHFAEATTTPARCFLVTRMQVHYEIIGASKTAATGSST